jgi:hypothetical protein
MAIRVTCLKEAVKVIRGQATKLKQLAPQAERESCADARRVAIKYASGPIKQAQLTAMGHPYSRRRPRPPLPTFIVNVQSGRFRGSFSVKQQDVAGETWTNLLNSSPEWAFLRAGTSRMLRRPLDVETAKAITVKRGINLAHAVNRAMQV